MPFSNTYSHNILNWMFCKTRTLTCPDAVYVGFCANDPEEDNGTFSELAGSGYSRVQIAGIQADTDRPIANLAVIMELAADRGVKNAKQINWNKATSKWQQAKGMGLFAAETGGEPFYYCKLDTPLDVDQNAVALFDPGEFCISMAKNDVSTATTTTNVAE